MKIPSRKPASISGNALIGVVIATAVIGMALTAYLSLVKNQNVLNMRSQAWNSTMPIIEAGCEDALAHLGVHGETNLFCDGWSQLGSIYYIKRWVGDSYYVVTISNWVALDSNSPIIEARGFVTLPIVASAPGPMFAVINGTPALYMGRGVRVQAKQEYLFTKALATDGAIDMNGNNVESDSFDSSNAAYSDNGQYPTNASKRRFNGDIASNSSVTNSINVGNANIKGKVSTGPKGSAKIGPNGKVGDGAWYNTSNEGFQPNALRDDMNVDFKEVSPPWTGGQNTPSSGTNAGTYYDYVIPAGNWQMTTLDLSSSKKAIITGNATLYVTTTFDIHGTVTIAPGASLKLYIGAASASIQGNGVVNNTGYATNLLVYGLPNCKDITVGGNGTFIGAVYAPQAKLKLDGGGNSDTDFIGAAIAQSAVLNGHFQFHYDEALRKKYPRGYVVGSWNEMSPAEVKATALDCSVNGVGL